MKAAVDHPSCDDDVVREFYISTIKKFVYTALDELESMKQVFNVMKRCFLRRAFCGKITE